MGPVHRVKTEVLDVAYVTVGPAEGQAVMLLHGFPYDVHSYERVAPLLAQAGLRVIVPYLRGHGATRSLGGSAARSGEQAALGSDVIELLDALGIDSAVLAGYDWGARAACVAAALWPSRCTGLVSVNSYLIQDLTAANQPLPAALEAGFWYFWYFATVRGENALRSNPRGIAEVIWLRNSPAWNFDEQTLARAAEAFDNADYADVVLHSYRHRLGLAGGHPRYAAVQAALTALPVITVPTVTIDGLADGNFPATDAGVAAAHFTGPRVHMHVADAGHNLPQEAPHAFADAVREVLDLARAGQRHRTVD
ncbi:alpha/beta hydrolase [Terrabacter sp. Soil811]|nr:alpha/beta hydrolase [Terrabacter sp. Soil811]